jgi:hypothetical protein
MIAASEWGRDISGLPPHVMSETWLGSIGFEKRLHPDFGSMYNGGPWGIPYMFFNATLHPPTARGAFTYASESDTGPYPPVHSAPVEGGCDTLGDRHTLMLDVESCTLYEVFKSVHVDDRNVTGGATILGDSGAIFPTRVNRPRPLGWTSSDAAGLPVFPGLVLYHEVVVRKEIRHAIRFTAMLTQRSFKFLLCPDSARAYFTPPATHFAGPHSRADFPPLGMRVRVKSSFNCQQHSDEFRVICTALKKYGMILSDLGGDLFITGAPHPRWNDAAIAHLKNIPGSVLEVVDTGAKLCLTPACT